MLPSRLSMLLDWQTVSTLRLKKKRLIKLWMAEEVADSHLVELTFRNMLQVVERNEFGRPKRCKMHDLLRELALSISIKEKFGAVHDGEEEMKECNARLSLTNAYVGKQLCFSTGFLKLRSLRIRNFPQ